MLLSFLLSSSSTLQLYRNSKFRSLPAELPFPTLAVAFMLLLKMGAAHVVQARAAIVSMMEVVEEIIMVANVSSIVGLMEVLALFLALVGRNFRLCRHFGSLLYIAIDTIHS